MTTTLAPPVASARRPAAAEVAERLTIVVPVYDEAERIEGVVREIAAELARLETQNEILILNDGSTDWSPELEQRLTALGPVRLEHFYPNRGKGAVLNDAFSLLHPGYAAIIDADGEYLAEDLLQVIRPLMQGEADWVMGSRYGFGRQRPRQYLMTYLVNRLINLWFFLLSGLRFRDLLTGLYAFRTTMVRDMRLFEPRFSYTAELLMKLRRHGAVRWREVPIGYRFRSYAEGKKIRWWETGTILLAMLRYRFAARG